MPAAASRSILPHCSRNLSNAARKRDSSGQAARRLVSALPRSRRSCQMDLTSRPSFAVVAAEHKRCRPRLRMAPKVLDRAAKDHAKDQTALFDLRRRQQLAPQRDLRGIFERLRRIDGRHVIRIAVVKCGLGHAGREGTDQVLVPLLRQGEDPGLDLKLARLLGIDGVGQKPPAHHVGQRGQIAGREEAIHEFVAHDFHRRALCAKAARLSSSIFAPAARALTVVPTARAIAATRPRRLTYSWSSCW